MIQKPVPSKKARKVERRQRRKEQSAAVAADNWTARPETGRDRPTPERRAKGSFRLRDAEDAGVTVAFDETSTMLDVLAMRGQITREQAQGGHDFAALMERTRLVSQGRSCLNFEPVGHDDNAEPTHAELRDQEDRRELYLACGMAVWAELRHVCVDQQRPRDVAALRAGLDLCVKFWR